VQGAGKIKNGELVKATAFSIEGLAGLKNLQVTDLEACLLFCNDSRREISKLARQRFFGRAGE